MEIDFESVEDFRNRSREEFNKWKRTRSREMGRVCDQWQRIVDEFEIRFVLMIDEFAGENETYDLKDVEVQRWNHRHDHKVSRILKFKNFTNFNCEPPLLGFWSLGVVKGEKTGERFQDRNLRYFLSPH
jgi:hypothetical protein